MITIGLAGYDGGKMARSPAVDHCIVCPSANIPRIQEAQATVYHALLEVVFHLLAPSPQKDGSSQKDIPEEVIHEIR
jgi:D-sedoheptulose 7-phosphate isomerase